MAEATLDEMRDKNVRGLWQKAADETAKDRKIREQAEEIRTLTELLRKAEANARHALDAVGFMKMALDDITQAASDGMRAYKELAKVRAV